MANPDDIFMAQVAVSSYVTLIGHGTVLNKDNNPFAFDVYEHKEKPIIYVRAACTVCGRARTMVVSSDSTFVANEYIMMLVHTHQCLQNHEKDSGDGYIGGTITH